VAIALLFFLLILKPEFLTLSRQRHAPLLLSVGIGVLVGVLAQRSKLCFVSGIRNVFLINDLTILAGFVFFILGAGGVNLLLGQSHFGVHMIGSSDILWSFLGLALVGMGCTMLGGCPFRQLVLASQGNTDSVLSLAGLAVGAALSYNLDFAFVGESVEMPGKIAVVGGILLLLVFGVVNSALSDRQDNR
jgi:YedE family putative selenium metabolism protein